MAKLRHHFEAVVEEAWLAVKAVGGGSFECSEKEGADAGARSLVGWTSDEVCASGGKGREFEGGVQGAVEVDPLYLLAVEALQLGIGDFCRTNRSVVEELAGNFGFDDVLDD